MARVKLDNRDLRILSILSRDGRLSKTELAKRVNLSATPCWERLKRLEEAGIISGYRAEVSLRDLGPHVEIFLVAELDNHKAETFQAFERAMGDYPEITDAWALGGGVDYLIRVVTKDIDSYQRLVDSLLERRTGLAKYFTYIVTKSVKTGGVPPLETLFGSASETL
ncbi:MAG: Lrp/AsnC family transcriptional regulator [Rhodospirillum sp.]|nr:Lrp/AsnC family transcriptional regulator [Rhodospirillum sp.]MCF8490184.1 Lrp/AsnC family transcriptional regulator [Rhodospirillum sp.]MCF8502868.1 Lrp/AsnC family transcriptional regulator [Rhodospirillum sp.]